MHYCATLTAEKRNFKNPIIEFLKQYIRSIKDLGNKETRKILEGLNTSCDNYIVFNF